LYLANSPTINNVNTFIELAS